MSADHETFSKSDYLEKLERSLERLRKLAREFGGQVFPPDECAEKLAMFEAIIDGQVSLQLRIEDERRRDAEMAEHRAWLAERAAKRSTTAAAD